jgi:hypothetical protein
MTDFRKRLLGICGVALAFAGFANAQYTCSNPSSASTLMRAEGTTEQTADLLITCATSATNPVATVAGTANLTLSVSPALPITSKVLATSGTAYTEALAFVSAPATPTTPVAGTFVQGVVTGAGTMTFTGIPTAACAASTACTFVVTVTNVRVNATSLGAGPVSISESALLTAGGFPATVNPVLVPATAVGIVINGLTSAKATSSTLASACSGTGTTPQAAFTLTFGENFSTAFKVQGSAATNGTVGAWTEPMLNTETGYIPAAFPSTTASAVANSGTRIKVIFSNIPTGMTLYVPLSISSPGTATNGSAVLTSSENGAFSAVTGNGALTVSGGTATAIYEIVAQANGVSQIDNFSLPVTYTLTANSITTNVPALSATVQFASGSAGNVPGFVVGSSTNTVTGPAVSLCSTTIMFPYMTNSSGFDTGIAISNTSTDNLKSGGGNSVTAQNGICSLSFYGTGAPTSAVNTPSVSSGTTYAATLSSLAPGFTGYAIANCNFQFGHGFVYISYNLTQTNGVSMGYLGLVVPAGTRPGGETLGH